MLSPAQCRPHVCPSRPAPALRECWARDHLSAISALSPEGELYVHCPERAINAVDVVALLEPLWREVPGRLLFLWDGAPIHRRHLITEILAHGAAQRLHVERLPADAPELNPGAGLWGHLKGFERRNVCCFNLGHLRQELREAVKRVRRKPRVIEGFFSGAKL